MGPPGSQDGAMPPPTAPGAPDAHDNGPAAPATALVTTGPDGAPLDEGSQQSTLSNASAGTRYTYLALESCNNVGANGPALLSTLVSRASLGTPQPVQYTTLLESSL